MEQGVCGKYRSLLSTVGEGQGGLAAIHRSRIKDAVGCGKGFVHVTHPAPRAGTRAGMHFHRSADASGKISSQVDEVEWLGELENHKPGRACGSVDAASVLERLGQASLSVSGRVVDGSFLARGGAHGVGQVVVPARVDWTEVAELIPLEWVRTARVVNASNTRACRESSDCGFATCKGHRARRIRELRHSAWVTRSRVPGR